MQTKKLTVIALLTAVLCVISPWAIPIGPVPISLATFAVYTISAITSWKKGTFAVLLYILIGAIGLPVFSNAMGGVQKLFGITGGYIWGYVICALIIGMMVDKFETKKWVYPISMILGTLACYLIGISWFMFFTGKSLQAAFVVCIVPFILFDIIKIAAASLFSYKLRFLIKDKFLKDL